MPSLQLMDAGKVLVHFYKINNVQDEHHFFLRATQHKMEIILANFLARDAMACQ